MGDFKADQKIIKSLAIITDNYILNISYYHEIEYILLVNGRHHIVKKNNSKFMEKDKLSVIIPAYNENENITNTLNECISSLEGVDTEIIVVDDGSNDGTHIKVGEFAKQHNNIKIIRYDENQGKGFAIKHGFKCATGDLIALIDADMNIHPRLILGLLENMNQTGADIVVGSKRHPSSKVDYPFTRKILSHIYYLFVKTLFSIPVKDTQVGLKLYKRSVLEDVLPKVLVKKYAFDIEILSNAIRMGYNITSAPVEVSTCFNSHINYKAIWYMLIDTCAVFYRMNILHYYDKQVDQSKLYNKITSGFSSDLEIIDNKTSQGYIGAIATIDNKIPPGFPGYMGIIGKNMFLGYLNKNSYAGNHPLLIYNIEKPPITKNNCLDNDETDLNLKVE